MCLASGISVCSVQLVRKKVGTRLRGWEFGERGWGRDWRGWSTRWYRPVEYHCWLDRIPPLWVYLSGWKWNLHTGSYQQNDERGSVISRENQGIKTDFCKMSSSKGNWVSWFQESKRWDNDWELYADEIKSWWNRKDERKLSNEFTEEIEVSDHQVQWIVDYRDE